MVIKDRFTIGFIAGVIGGMLMNLVDYISYILNIVEVRFIDWASVFIFGIKTDTLAESIVALLGQLVFSGFIGILFAYIIPQTTSKFLYFKGIIYALLVWFFSYAIIVLFDVTLLVPIDLGTVLNDIVLVSIFGLVLAFVHKKLYFAAGDELQETD